MSFLVGYFCPAPVVGGVHGTKCENIFHLLIL